MVKKWVAIIALSSSLAIGACNTVKGAADDVASTTDCVDGKKDNC